MIKRGDQVKPKKPPYCNYPDGLIDCHLQRPVPVFCERNAALFRLVHGIHVLRGLKIDDPVSRLIYVEFALEWHAEQFTGHNVLLLAVHEIHKYVV